jgi:hypothetical protein
MTNETFIKVSDWNIFWRQGYKNFSTSSLTLQQSRPCLGFNPITKVILVNLCLKSKNSFKRDDMINII